MRSYRSVFLMFCASIFLTGCMVGPDFHSPKAPDTTRYTQKSLPSKTASTPGIAQGGRTQYFVNGQDIPAEWWTLFHSPVLNGLVQRGLDNSPNLAAAEAALCVSKEAFNAQVGTSLYPQVSLQADAQRNHVSSASISGTNSSSLFNLYNVNFPVTYTLDVFGGLRRQIEALRDQVTYQQFQLEAAWLTLTSNIVTTTITIASLQEQIQATQELVKIQTDQLRIVKGQFALGGVSQANVLSQQAQLAQTEASLPPLQQRLAQSAHALATLVGSVPSDLVTPILDLDKIHLPTRLPVTVPSLLVRQRPDIRASEALLAAASAQIGVATANLYPQFNLSGSYGWTSISTGNFFSPAHNVWDFGAALMQPVFNGGALQAQKREAIASYQEAAAQYRQTVLQAFQNVADALRAVQHDAETLRAERNAEMASRRAMLLTSEQFKLGGVNYVALLTANQQYRLALINRIQAQATRYNDTTALFQALGGGWWNQNMTQQSGPMCCIKVVAK
ncbi:MAG TPA: efflux transporter outer membrane subunit [Gammaproteobacteria bacterium]|nr:efflux transporter outer membrane subunit [Gammaproteobacteria bacterium]